MKAERILFMGSKLLGLKCLKEMVAVSRAKFVGVITIDDSADSRSQFNEFKTFCLVENLPIFVVNGRKDAEEIILNQKVSLVMVMGWYWLISKEIIDAVPFGFIGVHNSLLPKYRGGSPLVWSIINGEQEVGFSMFSFTEGMDDGKIWMQESFKLGHNEKIGEVLFRIEERLVSLLKDQFVPLIQGKLIPSIQNEEEVTYCAQRIPADGRIDWSMPAQRVHDFIRAQSSPYPGAFTLFGNENLIISDTELADEIFFGTPGQVGRVTPIGVYVICGDSKAIIVKEVSFQGGTAKANRLLKSIKTRFTK